MAKTDALGAEIGSADVRGHAAGTREGLDRVTGSVKGRSYEFQLKHIKMLSSERGCYSSSYFAVVRDRFYCA